MPSATPHHAAARPGALAERWLLPVLAFLFAAIMIPGLRGVRIDMDCWERWAVYIHRNGLGNAYGSGTNYPPLYQYVLWLFGWMAGGEEAIVRYSGYLRLVTLAAEYWGLWTVYLWTGKRQPYTTILLCSLLNVAYSYDTMIWGQVDGLLAALAAACLYQGWRGRWVWSAVLLVLALNMKLQAIVFVPLWGLLMMGWLHRADGWRKVLVIIPAMLATQALLLVPFATGKSGVMAVWQAVTGAVDTYPSISMQAHNMWYLITRQAGPGNPDSVLTPIGTYYHIGLVSFAIGLAIALFPVMRHTFQTLRRRDTPPLPRETIWLCAALSVLVFFYFNTRMHERYSHPAFIFLTAYAFYTGRVGLYLLFSLAFFLNMERVVTWLMIPNYDTLFFDERFIASLFGFCIISIGVTLYRGRPSAAEGG